MNGIPDLKLQGFVVYKQVNAVVVVWFFHFQLHLYPVVLLCNHIFIRIYIIM